MSRFSFGAVIGSHLRLYSHMVRAFIIFCLFYSETNINQAV